MSGSFNNAEEVDSAIPSLSPNEQVLMRGDSEWIRGYRASRKNLMEKDCYDFVKDNSFDMDNMSKAVENPSSKEAVEQEESDSEGSKTEVGVNKQTEEVATSINENSPEKYPTEETCPPLPPNKQRVFYQRDQLLQLLAKFTDGKYLLWY